MVDEPQSEAQPDKHSPMSLPGEPQFAFGSAEVIPGVQMVTMVINTGNGIVAQVVIRPDLALTVAKMLSDQAKLARSGIVLPSGNGAVKEFKLRQGAP